jgi:hypothetical protein
MIELEETYMGIPIMKTCVCKEAEYLNLNLERGWRGGGLISAPKISSSELTACVNQDVYITASNTALRSHLRHVGIKQGPNWSFCVSTDAECITAWLANVGLSGKEILDPDAASVSLEKLTLLDLVMPPGLFIIVLGVKWARNVAMPEVFLEALSLRSHAGKPTWVVDQPEQKLDANHLCYSDQAVDTLRNWKHFDLTPTGPGLSMEMIGSGGAEPHTTHSGYGSLQPNTMTISGSGNSSGGGARRVELPTALEKKKPWKGNR